MEKLPILLFSRMKIALLVLVLASLFSCDYMGTKLKIRNSYSAEIYVFLNLNYPDTSIENTKGIRPIPRNKTMGVGALNWAWDEIFKEVDKVTVFIVPSYNVDDKANIINLLDPNVKKVNSQ